MTPAPPMPHAPELALPHTVPSAAPRHAVILNDTAAVNGGAAKVAIASAIGLAKRGWAVHFLAGAGPVDPELAATPNLTVRCLHHFEILTDPNRLRAATQGLWSEPARAAMGQLLAALAPANTVVHVHTWGKALSSSVVAEAGRRGFPVLLTLHDYLFACPTGTLFHHGHQEVCQLEPMGPRCLATNCDARRYTHKLWRVARHSVAHTAGGFGTAIQTFIALGEHSYGALKPYLPEGARVGFVPNFVDILPPPGSPGTPEQAAGLGPVPIGENLEFIFSGRLVPEKGPLLAAEAAQVAGVPLTLIGDGPQRELLAAGYPAARVLGWLPYAESLAALRRARALLLPSLWLEVQPLVVLEALANGIPVLLPDNSAARDLVEDGVTGLFFRAGDARDLARKITALTDAGYAAALGEAAYRRYWAAPPTLARHLDALEALYLDTLRG